MLRAYLMNMLFFSGSHLNACLVCSRFYNNSLLAYTANSIPPPCHIHLTHTSLFCKTSELRLGCLTEQENNVSVRTCEVKVCSPLLPPPLLVSTCNKRSCPREINPAFVGAVCVSELSRSSSTGTNLYFLPHIHYPPPQAVFKVFADFLHSPLSPDCVNVRESPASDNCPQRSKQKS